MHTGDQSQPRASTSPTSVPARTADEPDTAGFAPVSPAPEEESSGSRGVDQLWACDPGEPDELVTDSFEALRDGPTMDQGGATDDEEEEPWLVPDEITEEVIRPATMEGALRGTSPSASPHEEFTLELNTSDLAAAPADALLDLPASALTPLP